MLPPKQYGLASNRYGRRERWFLAGLYAVLLLVLSLAPGRKLPTIPDWFALFSPDKVAHFGAYGLFALLLSAALRSLQIRRAVPWAVFLAALYGALMEILQGISGTGRNFDPVDMVANLLGAILGGLAYLLLQRINNNIRLRNGGAV